MEIHPRTRPTGCHECLTSHGRPIQLGVSKSSLVLKQLNDGLPGTVERIATIG